MVIYTIKTEKSCQEAVHALQGALKERKFGILHTYDLKEIFKSKGIEFSEYLILSVCNPTFAKEALDTNLSVGALLPCRISVYDDKGITVISLLKPTEAIGLLGDDRLNELSTSVEEILIKAINAIE